VRTISFNLLFHEFTNFESITISSRLISFDYNPRYAVAIFILDVLTAGPGPPGCRQTTTMAEEIVFCCTNIRSLSTDPHPRLPCQVRQVPAAWGPRSVPITPTTVISNRFNSSNRPTCARLRASRASRIRNVTANRIKRLKAASMSEAEWWIGSKNPRRSPRSTSASARRLVRRIANVLGIIRPKAVSMWGSEWGVSGTRRPWTNLRSITRSAERVVNRVASVSDTIRPKAAIKPTKSAVGWANGTRSHPTRRRSISPSAPLMVDNRVASVSAIIRPPRSFSPHCRGITVAGTLVPIVSRDSMTSVRCTASSGSRAIVTRSATRSCASTRWARMGLANTRTRTHLRAPSRRRRSRHRRRRHRQTTVSSHHRHCRPVRARSTLRVRVWLVTLLLIAFFPPILRGPSTVPTVPLQDHRCPPRSVSPPPNDCWSISNQSQATARINNATLVHLIACSRDPPLSWEDFRLDFKRDSRVAGFMSRMLVTPPFPQTGYYPPRRYMRQCQRDSSASRRGTWASRPFTIGILGRIHQRQHITTGIRRWRRPPRGHLKSI